MNNTLNKYAKKVVAAGVALTVFVSMNSFVAAANYQVKSGDSLFLIGKRNGLSIEQLKLTNGLNREYIFIGENLVLPDAYTVKAGDTIFLLAKRFNTSIDMIVKLNNLKSDLLLVGQKLLIAPNVQTKTSVNLLSSSNTSNNTTNTTTNTTTNITINNSVNKLASNTSNYYTVSESHTLSVTYYDYTVKSGDTSWTIATNHGIPFHELMKVNNLTQNSNLSIGQKVKIPKHNVPINNPQRQDRGVYMDWWTQAQYVFAIGSVAKATDLQTGKSWYVKRTMGANHADCEPLTAKDTEIMRQVWGGKWSWSTRAILIEIDGHRIAASASAMPHDVQAITNNNFQGHHDIYFGNSIRHVDGLPDANHEKKVKLAAGIN